jgi:hypothetical protein
MRRAAPTTSVRTAALAAVPFLLLAACGDDDPATTPTSAAPSTTAPVVTTTSATPSLTASGGPGCPIQTAPDPAATVVTASVIAKKVTAPSRSVTVKVGSKVRVAITTDVADEVHVHTYDLKEDVAAGCTSAIDFVANIPGTVEVELEDAGLEVLEIKATP